MIPGGLGKFKRSGLPGAMKGFSNAFPLLNISTGGVAFESEEDFKPGEELIFQLLVPEEPPLNLFSQVRWQKGFDSIMPRTTGIEFIPSGEDQDLNPLEKLETLRKFDAQYGNIMQPQIMFKPELGVVHVVAKGDLNNKVCLEIVKRAAKIAEEHECNKAVCDFTDTTLTESTAGIYNYPRLARSENIPACFKVAIRYSRDEENYRFLETVCINLGYSVRVFKDNNDAVAWLIDS